MKRRNTVKSRDCSRERVHPGDGWRLTILGLGLGARCVYIRMQQANQPASPIMPVIRYTCARPNPSAVGPAVNTVLYIGSPYISLYKTGKPGFYHFSRSDIIISYYDMYWTIHHGYSLLCPYTSSAVTGLGTCMESDGPRYIR